MRRIFGIKYWIFIVPCWLSLVAIAQTDTCISNLKNAGTDYEQGNYDQAISILTRTLQGCPLSKQDQIQANKLLILCYIGIDNLEAANSTVETIMKIDPNYTPDKFKDDIRLTALFSNYKPEPTLAINVGGGINFPDINVVKTYSVVHEDDNSELASYKPLIGYQLSAGIEKRIYRSLWGDMAFQYRKTSYEHNLDSVENTTILYSENISYIDIPVSLKFYFLKNSFKPYLQAGADLSILVKALSTTRRENEQDVVDIVDRTAYRNQLDVGYFGSVGATYQIKAFKLFADFRYTYFPGLVNKEGTRYADDVNLYKYYYVDDDFKMNNIQVGIGLSYILSYKISKVKE